MPPIRSRANYKYRSPETWDLIRTAYMRGESGPSLARRYDVTTWNIYKKAMEEGWSRRALIIAEAEARAGTHATSYEAARLPVGDPRYEPWPEFEPTTPSETGERPFSRINPPEDFRGGPRPLPGLPHRPTHVWTPPPGYGPMPPHLVPPVQRPPSDDGAPPVTPAEVADQAVAAAGRAIAEGRYAEAERLGKLAETMRRQAGAGTAPRSRLAEPDEDEADEDRMPAGDRLLNCTLKTCALHAIHQQARAVGQRVMNLARAPEQEDLGAWADMAEAMGGVRDPELAAVLAAYRAEGMAGLPPHLTTVFGPQGDVPPVSFPEVFRGR